MLHQRIQSFVVVAVVVVVDAAVVGVGRSRNFGEISHENATTNMEPCKGEERRRMMSCAVTSKSTMLLADSLTHIYNDLALHH